MVYHTVHVLDDIFIVSTCTVWTTNITEHLDKSVNWRNCGFKWEGLYSIIWRPGARHSLERQVLKLFWWNWLSQSTSRTLGWENHSSCVNPRELRGIRPTAAIMSPPFAAVSTVRERGTFTSSTAVYSSCFTQTLLQLLKRISVRVLSSTGTSTSTRLLQVPKINSMSPCSSCVYFTVIRSQLIAAVRCCL
jgi:hypothetical protein